MELKHKLIILAVTIALVILLLPIIPYKNIVDKCQNNSTLQEPTVCTQTYIPFQEGFPFRFYFQYGSGISTFNGPNLIFLGKEIILPSKYEEGLPVSWQIPFVLDFLILSSFSYFIVNKFFRKSA